MGTSAEVNVNEIDGEEKIVSGY